MRFARRGFREDPFSERSAFAFKVACADPGGEGISIYCRQ